MSANAGELSRAASRLLGWLNFSDGRPDPKWQRQFDDTFVALGRSWPQFRDWLLAELDALQQSGNVAFRDCSQAREVIPLIFDHALPAYRAHHSDLLAHLSDRDLFTPFFVARVAEALLAQGGPWSETDRVVRGTLNKINDYVGHRPIAVLEGRPQTDLYPNEKVRPVPIFIRGAGAAHGPYEDMVVRALDLLGKTDPDLLQEAALDPNLIDELAFDPRPIDHGHPVSRRPNYLFGEWDPHHIDDRGRFRRFIVRKNTLDDILTRVPESDSGDVIRSERQFEAGAVLAGTILMAAGTSGSGPTMFDSTVTLSKLVPKIARYRDSFYKRLIAGVEGPHGEKLRAEAAQYRQPFGPARQHVNQILSRQRAIELQESHLALLFAEMGYPEASRERAGRLEAVSVRMLAEIRLRLTGGQFAIAAGKLGEAAKLLEEIENYIHRGVNCGALADPWNAIGFQALFPLFASREDSVRDTRLDDLVDVMGRTFQLYSSLLTTAASAGETELRRRVGERMSRLAGWWDQHAAYEVGDLPRVRGEELAAAAEHVADALAGVRGAHASASDVAYWREHRAGFQSPAAFAQVVDALLLQRDFKSSMALLMTWLSDADQTPLEEGDHSFHMLASRWIRRFIESDAAPDDKAALVRRFFAHLEVNADDWGGVPEWSVPKSREKREDVYEAAYEEMTYRDTTDDDVDGAVAGGESPTDYFPLDDEAKRIEDRLAFLATTAKLWQEAVPFMRSLPPDQMETGTTATAWQATAQSWQEPLLQLLDKVHDLAIPAPVGGFEEVMEYDRRRMLREQLAETIINTCLETTRAIRMLGTIVRPSRAEPAPSVKKRKKSHRKTELPNWEPLAQELEIVLGQGDPASVRRILPRFFEAFRQQPLLFVPMSAGGHPRQILQSRQAQVMLRSLLERLPGLGLIRETYHFVQLAKTMEQNAPPAGRKVSEFDHLFPIALQSVLEALLDAAHSWPANDLRGDDALVELLRRITDSFLNLWLAHSQTLRLSIIESPPPGADWDDLRRFIKKYGSDLFTPHFLALANLRSLIHRGVDNWIDTMLREPEMPKLLEDVEAGRLAKSEAIRYLEYLAQALIEHHEEYRDYNSTTTQSDYGENLYLLIDFLKLKTSYDRYAWRMRPLVQAHAVLCRRGQDEAAVKWQASMAGFTRTLSDQLVNNLTQLERDSGLKLRTVRDRLEERFVRPLIIDRLAACVEPAMREAPNPPAEGGALQRMQEQLEPLTQQPVGIGLDVPEWLERLQEESNRVRQERYTDDRPTPRGLNAGVTLTFADLQRQLVEWEKPL